jgi:hypothetical protein
MAARGLAEEEEGGAWATDKVSTLDVSQSSRWLNAIAWWKVYCDVAKRSMQVGGRERRVMGGGVSA